MSKFNKGDIVDVQWLDRTTTRGIVHLSWGAIISDSGLPMVDVLLLDEGFIGHFEEEEVELALDEYEFAVMTTSKADDEQQEIRPEMWTTLEEAKEDLLTVTTGVGGEFYKDKFYFQINRRRKAGHAVGFQAHRW